MRCLHSTVDVYAPWALPVPCESYERAVRRLNGAGPTLFRRHVDMSDQEKMARTQADADLEREIRKERKFNLAEAIGRLAGPGAMKGVSPITRMQQAVAEIENWLTAHMYASAGELQVALQRDIKDSELLLSNYDQPLDVLAAYCRQVLESDQLLKELVREADVEWGRVFGERPYFDEEGVPPSPDDPYTVESVRKALTGLLDQLGAEAPRAPRPCSENQET
jgi:hypothetical protein